MNIKNIKHKQLLLLSDTSFVPFGDESNLLLQDESTEEAFHRLLPANADCSAYLDKLQKMLKAQSNIKKINEARQADGVEEKVNKEDDDPQLMGEAKTAMKEVVEMNNSDTLTLEDRKACHDFNMEMLNSLTSKIHELMKWMRLSVYVNGIKRHQNN